MKFCCTLNWEDNKGCVLSILEEEIVVAMMQIQLYKVPGLHGLRAVLYVSKYISYLVNAFI